MRYLSPYLITQSPLPSSPFPLSLSPLHPLVNFHIRTMACASNVLTTRAIRYAYITDTYITDTFMMTDTCMTDTCMTDTYMTDTYMTDTCKHAHTHTRTHARTTTHTSAECCFNGKNARAHTHNHTQSHTITHTHERARAHVRRLLFEQNVFSYRMSSLIECVLLQASVWTECVLL